MSIVEETTQIKSSKVAAKGKKVPEDNEEEERPAEKKSSSDPSKKVAFVSLSIRSETRLTSS